MNFKFSQNELIYGIVKDFNSDYVDLEIIDAYGQKDENRIFINLPIGKIEYNIRYSKNLEFLLKLR